MQANALPGFVVHSGMAQVDLHLDGRGLVETFRSAYTSEPFAHVIGCQAGPEETILRLHNAQPRQDVHRLGAASHVELRTDAPSDT